MASSPPPSDPISPADAAPRRDPWEVAAIVAGMEKLVARRAELLAGGAAPIGWKLAFGTETAMSKLGTTGPVVGFLTDATLLAPGAECSTSGWTAPKLEPEIAIHLGPGGEGVAGISTAIELADADQPPTETEAVLAGDIYHRAVVLDREAAPTPLSALGGAGTPSVLGGAMPATPGRIAARTERDGAEIVATDDAEAEVGQVDGLAAWTVTYLRHFGIDTAEGEGDISGSVVPPVDIGPGQHLRSELVGVGALTVAIA